VAARTDGAADASTLRDYILVLRRRRWIVLQAIVVVPLVAMVFSLQQDRTYRATAEVLLNQQNLALTLAGANANTAVAQPDRLLDTQARVADGPTIALRTLRALHVTDIPLRRFMRLSTVSTQKNVDILTFSVLDRRRPLTRRLATEFARQYTIYRRELDTHALIAARNEVDARMKELAASGQRSARAYADLADRAQQLATAAALQTSNASLIAPAGPATQVTPRPTRNTLLGLVLGVVLGVALAFLREALDTRMRTSKEIEDALGLPLLARIPSPPRLISESDQLVMEVNPDAVEAEPFRVLRTNFDFFNLERGAQTIMVTSAVGEEGKSTTIANLAIALARVGTRVALIDLDLRRPFLHRFFEFEGQPGVTDIAMGRALLQQPEPASADGQARGVARGSLQVLTAGPPTADPGELVTGHGLDALLADFKQRADIVLVDAPPLLVVSDAMALSAKVDAILVVSRLGVVRKHMLTELRRVLDACPADKLGLVVTGAELEADSYGYPNRYGYGSYRYHDTRT
jgi:capsular exopolysaccharide synthesis family protein